MTARLTSIGNVIVDVTLDVPALPERGGDVLGYARGSVPGGAFNTLAAAVRQGLSSRYAGAHGTGPFGDLVRAALAAEGIAVVHPATPGIDTGFDIALTDAGGERTFVTAFGAEATLTPEAVNALDLGPEDLLHVSGYGLLERSNGATLGPWLAGLGPDPLVLLDPGPLVRDIPTATWAAALGRANWLSCSAREARLLTGVSDDRLAADSLRALVPNVLVRLGPDGALLADGRGIRRIPGVPVYAIDTNGAGDAHSGALLAALARGEPAEVAVRAANLCAAMAAMRVGPATAPTLAEARSFGLARDVAG